MHSILISMLSFVNVDTVASVNANCLLLRETFRC